MKDKQSRTHTLTKEKKFVFSRLKTLVYDTHTHTSIALESNHNTHTHTHKHTITGTNTKNDPRFEERQRIVRPTHTQTDRQTHRR